MAAPRVAWRTAATAGAGAVLLTSCGGGGSSRTQSGAADAHEPACTIRHEIEPIAARFPDLGELQASTWCGIDLAAGSRFPGPTDIRLVGVLQAKDAGAVRNIMGNAGWKFTSATPKDLPRALAAVLPKDAQWLESAQYNDVITGTAYPGSFYFDRTSAQVLFDAVNPRRH